MPSKLVLPSASVLSSSPPRLCLPWVLTGCMITAALRIGLPLSSLTTRKFRMAVGSWSASFCAEATPSSARAERRVAIIRLIILFLIEFICRHSSECEGRGKARSRKCVSSRFFSGAAFALRTPGLACKLHQIGGDPGRVVTGNARLFQVVSQNRDHIQSFDGFEIDNDLACALERIFGLEFLRNRS